MPKAPMQNHSLAASLWPDGHTAVNGHVTPATGGGGVAAGVGLTDSGDGISIDPEQVPAVNLTAIEVDKIKELMALFDAGSRPSSALMSVVHDEITVELPVKPPKVPVSATRAANALLAKPELAWAVIQELHASKLLGPWEEVGDEDPDDDVDTIWVRRRTDGKAGVTVYRRKKGWKCGSWIAGPEVDTTTALATVDDSLLEAGLILA